jgi:hypothetical protein
MRRPLTTALLRGVLDAGRAWRLIAGLWLALLFVALPAGLTVFESLRGAIGARAVGQELRGAMDLVWLGEYQEAARGIAATVTAPVLGRTALLVNLEDRWRGDLVGSPVALVGLGLLWAAVWIFASGVALDRFLLGPDPPRGAGWAGTGARHFGRLTRLGLLSLPAYYAVHRLSAWLFPALEGRLRDVTQERVVLAWYLAAALGVALLLGLVELWFDYARVIAVGRDVSSGRRALTESARWLAANSLWAIGLQLALAAAGGAIVAGWLLLAPAPFESGWGGVAGVLLLGQLAVIARLVVRVGGLAAQSRLYRALSRRSGG